MSECADDGEPGRRGGEAIGRADPGVDVMARGMVAARTRNGAPATLDGSCRATLVSDALP